MDDLKPLNYSSKDNTINPNQSHNDISLGGENDLQDFDINATISVRTNHGVAHQHASSTDLAEKNELEINAPFRKQSEELKVRKMFDV